MPRPEPILPDDQESTQPFWGDVKTTEDAEYRTFVEKFEIKKTTDDCYTPAGVYETILRWVRDRYHIPDSAPIIRPFYPGADFTTTEYPEGCVVVDNPPFSIITKIRKWYSDHGVRFFLFAPVLTMFSGEATAPCSYVVAAAHITYENGAVVNTSFVTNLPGPKITVAPDLHDLVVAADEANRRKQHKQPPKYSYPDNVITAARLNYLAVHGVPLEITADEVAFTRVMDAQREHGKTLFGAGFYIGDDAAARFTAGADQAARNSANAAMGRAGDFASVTGAAGGREWPLSARELDIIAHLGK